MRKNEKSEKVLEASKQVTEWNLQGESKKLQNKYTSLLLLRRKKTCKENHK